MFAPAQLDETKMWDTLDHDPLPIYHAKSPHLFAGKHPRFDRFPKLSSAQPHIVTCHGFDFRRPVTLPMLLS